ncbi:MAG: leucine-rich repeat domain-containing protein, partial [Muribaculaceae bacterium]|nr:leucine-rich repeat domain-containing protein [Muribaculaceae bacterium]
TGDINILTGFTNCSFSSIKLPKTVNTLARHCFNGCENLKHIELPENLKTIKEDAFWGTEPDVIVIPSGIDCIEPNGLGGYSKTKIKAKCDLDIIPGQYLQYKGKVEKIK